MKKAILGWSAAAALMAGMCSCSSTNHDAPNPQQDIVVHWHRLETPPSVVTLYFACFGTDGLLLDQGDGNTTVTPDDPQCPKNGTPYQWVTRSGKDPAVVIQTTNGPVSVTHP
jgi:hypothetical protein